MPEEFVCPECAYSSDKKETCPFCEVGLVKIDEDEDNLSYTNEETNDYRSPFSEDFDSDIEEMPNAI